MFQKYNNHDWVITITMIALLVFGIIAIYSTTANSPIVELRGLVYRQVVFVALSLAVYFGLSKLNKTWLQVPHLNILVYVITVLLLIYVLVAGEVVLGAKRWINLSFFSIQPSEYAKIAMILMVSLIFSSDQDPGHKLSFNQTAKSQSSGIITDIKEIWHSIWFRKYSLSIASAVPLLALVFLQPALGNTLIILLIWAILQLVVFPQLAVLLWAAFTFIVGGLLTTSIINIYRVNPMESAIAFEPKFTSAAVFLLLLAVCIFVSYKLKIKWYYTVIVTVFASVMIFSSVQIWNNGLEPYQKIRVNAFIEGNENNSSGSRFQVIQSITAIGSGQLWGRGYLEGTQSGKNILTQAHNDFIFASIAEQFGFLGASMVIMLYILLIARIAQHSYQTENIFDRTCLYGIATTLLIHFFVNVSMNMGLMPVTGITLPMVSYGGSSTLAVLLMLGIAQSIISSKRSVDIADTLMVRSGSLEINI